MFLKLYVFLLLRFGVSIVLVINGHGTRLDDILVSGLARQAALHRIAISAKRRGSPRCAPGHMAEVERQERSGILTRSAEQTCGCTSLIIKTTKSIPVTISIPIPFNSAFPIPSVATKSTTSTATQKNVNPTAHIEHHFINACFIFMAHLIIGVRFVICFLAFHNYK